MGNQLCYFCYINFVYELKLPRPLKLQTFLFYFPLWSITLIKWLEFVVIVKNVERILLRFHFFRCFSRCFPIQEFKESVEEEFFISKLNHENGCLTSCVVFLSTCYWHFFSQNNLIFWTNRMKVLFRIKNISCIYVWNVICFLLLDF